MVRPEGVCVWGRSALYDSLEVGCARWEGLGMPELGSWRTEFVPQGAGVADFEESEGVFLVERGRSMQKAVKKE